MGLAEAVLASRRRHNLERLWPVGYGAAPLDGRFGHDDTRFSPEVYGESLATSNDVYSVVSRRARLMSSLRLRFYRGRGNDKKEVTSHPAADLYWRVNPFWTDERLARMDEMCMGVWGESFWALEPGGRGEPGEIWWMKPSRVKPVVDEKKYLKGFIYEPDFGGPTIGFNADEVIWFRYPNPIDQFSALSPLAAAKLAAETSAAMMQSNRNLHKDGLQLAGLIVPGTDKVSFSQDQATQLEENLLKRFSGADKAHRWAVLRYEAQFKQLSITPKDAEFVTGLSLTFRQVCRAYGMQSVLLNETENAPTSGVGVREMERAEWDGTLRPDANFRAAEIREQYLPRFRTRGAPDYCEFDFGTVTALQESASESWGREAQALDRGAITINEWRRSKGMPDVEWGDEPWLPLNKAQWVDGQLVVTPTPAAVEQPPDDEVNPANQPAQSKGETVERGIDHMAARRLIAEAFGDKRVNGHSFAGR